MPNMSLVRKWNLITSAKKKYKIYIGWSYMITSFSFADALVNRFNLHISLLACKAQCWHLFGDQNWSVLPCCSFWDPRVWSSIVIGHERFALHCTSLFNIWNWLLEYAFGLDANLYWWGGTSCRSSPSSYSHSSCVNTLTLAEQVDFTLATHDVRWSVLTVVVINCWSSTLNLEDDLTGLFTMYHLFLIRLCVNTNVLCKIWGSHDSDYEECLILGCYTLWLL
jgi:hypothetical protein